MNDKELKKAFLRDCFTDKERNFVSSPMSERDENKFRAYKSGFNLGYHFASFPEKK